MADFEEQLAALRGVIEQLTANQTALWARIEALRRLVIETLETGTTPRSTLESELRRRELEYCHAKLGALADENPGMASALHRAMEDFLQEPQPPSTT